MVLSNKLKIFTWHIHGSYLYYLSQANCEFFVPVDEQKSEGYGGLPRGNFDWPENIHEVDSNDVGNFDFDIILFQSKKNYIKDQFEILSERQRQLPKIFLEHDPPRTSPTDTKHITFGTDILLVHATRFNSLMWKSNNTTKVIEHGVIDNEITYSGALQKGVAAVNNILKRGRRLGLDILRNIQKEIPIDVIGMGSEEIGGLGEIPHKDIGRFLSKYRFFLNPIRYTSLGLSVCEAMMTGMPVVSLATTEMPTVIKDGVSGFIGNDIDVLIEKMKVLLESREYGIALGANARKEAEKRFSIDRFTYDWKKTFFEAIGVQIEPENFLRRYFQGGLS